MYTVHVLLLYYYNHSLFSEHMYTNAYAHVHVQYVFNYVCIYMHTNTHVQCIHICTCTSVHVYVHACTFGIPFLLNFLSHCDCLFSKSGWVIITSLSHCGCWLL